MTTLSLPTNVRAVFSAFRTCEFSTLAKNGTPITWPTLPFFVPEEGRFVITTSVGLPDKALNVRRNSRVSLLFSDPTASGLDDPPIVLVQGTAVAPDEVSTSIKGFEAQLRMVFERQPASKAYSASPLMRWLFDWYYMRLQIVVTPQRISWWERGNLSQSPKVQEVFHVA